MRQTIALWGLLSIIATVRAGELQSVDVFVGGQEGYHTFRIPSVIVTPKGTVLAFCEGRRGGGGDAGDIDLVLKRSADGGKTWGPLETVWDDAANTSGNPCPVIDADQRN
jgi:sialidase-1